MNHFDWRVFWATVQGATHQRSDLPNQDHIDWYPKKPERCVPPVIMAISDGHGSPKYFRSDIGSKIATQQAIKIIKDILKSELIDRDLLTVKRSIDERLPRELVQAWRKGITRHLEDNPMQDEELEKLELKEGFSARKYIEAHPEFAYGATLLVVFITEIFIAYLQLGDGDILVVSDGNEVSYPLAKDDRLFANETTSLSSESAWVDFRVGFQPIVDLLPPALIMISTDGYSNSFHDQASFDQVGVDLLRYLRCDGVRQVRSDLQGWINEASRAGSGDDITLGLIYRETINKQGA